MASFLASKLFNTLKSKAEELGLQQLASDLASEVTNRAQGLLEKYLEEKNEGHVDTLLERVANEILTEDRREALNGLKGILASGNPFALATMGDKGLAIIMAVLRDERGDLGLVQTAVETLRVGLTAVLSLPVDQATDRYNAYQQQQAASYVFPDISAINAELLARGEGYLQLLWTLLEDEPVGVPDPVTRYEVLQILRRIASVSPALMEQAVLTGPTCLGRLLDLVVSEKELVRSEALGLLGTLAKDSEHVQNIVTYENAFDRILNVYEQEGGASGASNDNAADALDVLSVLLRSNVKSHSLFRELNFCPRMLALLQTAVQSLPAFSPSMAVEAHMQTLALNGSGRPIIPTAQLKALHSLLGVFQSLLPRKGAQSNAKSPGFLDSARLDNMRGFGNQLLGLLLGLSFHPRLATSASGSGGGGDQAAASAIADSVRAACFGLVACICEGQAETRDQLIASRVVYPMDARPLATRSFGVRPVGPDEPHLGALHAIVRRAIFGASREECLAATLVIEKFCSGNAEGQVLLSSTLSAALEEADFNMQFYALREVVEPEPTASVGAELIRALLAVSLAPEGPPSTLAAKEATFACLILASIVANNSSAKESMARVPLQLPPSLAGRFRDPSVAGSVLASLGRAVSQLAYDPVWSDLCSSALLFLTSWAQGCETAALCILQRDESIGLITEVARCGFVSSLPTGEGPMDLPAAGLATCFLGIVASSPALSSTAWSCQTILDYAANYATVGKLLGSLDGLRNSMLWDVLSRPPPIYVPKLLGGSSNSALFVSNLCLLDVSAGEMSLRDMVRTLYVVHGDASSRRAALEAELSRAHDLSSARTILQDFVGRIEELEARNRVLMLSIQRAVPGTDGRAGGASLDLIAEADLKASRLESELSKTLYEKEDLENRLRAVQSSYDEVLQRSQDLQNVVNHQQSELSSLAAAYAELEAHAKLLESEQYSPNVRQAVSGSGDTPAKVELEDRVQAAVQSLREELERENDEALNDLLVCLGQEEAKVEKLRSRLEELGEDVDKLLVS